MYPIIIIPLISGLVAQGLKFFTKAGKKRKFNFKNLVAYSGMPSGHSAIVVSLATTIGISEGFHTSAFAISLILAVIVIRDAMGIRMYLGEHGRTLNILVRDLKDDDVLEKRYPHLLENIGHTPLQVTVGSLIGLAISLIGSLFF